MPQLLYPQEGKPQGPKAGLDVWGGACPAGNQTKIFQPIAQPQYWLAAIYQPTECNLNIYHHEKSQENEEFVAMESRDMLEGNEIHTKRVSCEF
jgi:hypothetical protein